MSYEFFNPDGVESNDFGIGIVLSDLIFVFVPLGTVGG